MVLFISQDTLVCDAVVYKNTLKTLLYLYSSWKSNSLHEKMYFKNSYHSILFMLLTNQYILALFAQLTFFSFDIFRVMFWSAMLYIPLFFLSLRIINFWHWKSEEVRWKPTEFVGSTALAEQNTHTHTHTWKCPRPHAHILSKQLSVFKSGWSFIFHLFQQVWHLQMYQFKICFHTNSHILWLNAIPVSRGWIGKQLF